jgi:poly(beta-D-mannuronate) lyase
MALAFLGLGACTTASTPAGDTGTDRQSGGRSGTTSSGGNRGDGGASGGSSASGGASGGSVGQGGSSSGGSGSGGASDGSGGSVGQGGVGGAGTDAAGAGTGGAGDDAGPTAPGAMGDELPACGKMIDVGAPAALAPAVAAAMPGDCLIVADGAYGPVTITAKGTAAAPIQIRAKNLLKATAGALVLTGSEYVVVQGFASASLLFVNSNHSRITRCQVRGGSGGIWVRVEEQKGCMSGCSNTPPGTSDDTRIDHCDIGGGSAGGADVINQTGLSTKHRFDHNYIHDVSGDHIMTVGCCGPKYDYFDTGHIIEFNVFDKVRVGSAEMLSIKSSNTTFRYNTIRDHGGDIDIRAGRHDYIYGNFILGPGSGIRLYEDDHKIYNNYVNAGTALNLGAANGIHAGVKNATIVFNTFIGGLNLNGSGNVITNNLIVGGGGGTGNLSGAADALGLVKMGDLLTPTMTSKAIGAGMGSFPFVTDDLAGNPRGAKPDVGALQFSTAMALRRPLTAADVGPAAP